MVATTPKIVPTISPAADPTPDDRTDRLPRRAACVSVHVGGFRPRGGRFGSGGERSGRLRDVLVLLPLGHDDLLIDAFRSSSGSGRRCAPGRSRSACPSDVLEEGLCVGRTTSIGRLRAGAITGRDHDRRNGALHVREPGAQSPARPQDHAASDPELVARFDELVGVTQALALRGGGEAGRLVVGRGEPGRGDEEEQTERSRKK